MKRSLAFRLGVVLLLIVPVAVWAAPMATFFWAQYDGLTEDFRSLVESSFNKQSKDAQIQIVSIPWENMQDKLNTAVAGGAPPDISIVGTRWILDYMATDSVVEVTPYLSKATLSNINPAAMEAKVKGKLMGIPVAAGARILAINNDIAKDVPRTMEQLEADAIKANDPPDHFGLFMPGKAHIELTDFCYYFYAAGGNYFATKADGSYGKCTVNSPAGASSTTTSAWRANPASRRIAAVSLARANGLVWMSVQRMLKPCRRCARRITCFRPSATSGLSLSAMTISALTALPWRMRNRRIATSLPSPVAGPTSRVSVAAAGYSWRAEKGGLHEGCGAGGWAGGRGDRQGPRAGR